MSLYSELIEAVDEFKEVDVLVDKAAQALKGSNNQTTYDVTMGLANLHAQQTIATALLVIATTLKEGK